MAEQLRISLSGASKILTLSHAALNGHFTKYLQGKKSSLCQWLVNLGYSQSDLQDIQHLGLTIAQFKDVIGYYEKFGRHDKNRDLDQILRLSQMSVEDLTKYVLGLDSPRKLTDYTVTLTLPIKLKRILKQKATNAAKPVNKIIIDLINNHL